MSKSKNRWLIRDGKGRIIGPFTTDEVLKRIRHGELSGSESIALFPGSDWRPISQDPEFYDQLLDFIVGDNSVDHVVEDFEETFTEMEDKSKEDNSLIAQDGSKEKSKHEESTQSSSQQKPEEPKRGKAHRVSTHSSEKTKKDSTSTLEDVIELKRVKDIVSKQKRKITLVPIFVAVLIVAGAVAFLYQGLQSSHSQVQLIVPKEKGRRLSKDEANRFMKRGLSAFVQDSFLQHLQGQNAFVQVIESGAKIPEAYSMLCMTQLELWPFTAQGSKELQSIKEITRRVGQEYPTSVASSACRVVSYIVQDEFKSARSTVTNVFESQANGGRPLTLFYYLNAIIFAAENDFDSALSYIKYTKDLWPQWYRIYSYEAELFRRKGLKDEAATRYRQILKSNPDHIVSRLELGSLEVIHYAHYDLGEELIRQGLSSEDKASPVVQARAYYALAVIGKQRGQKSKALDFAKKSYQLDPTNAGARKIVLSLGGEESLMGTKVLDRQLIAEGRQHVREGNCNAAQALFKTAFEMNPKNGTAALEAAQCLWELSLSSEAIDWLNRAIKADRNLIQAYTLMADYYTQRFDYENAGRVLSRARQVAPSNYEVFRGFALFELRRNNFKGAIQFGEKAKALYETDVGTLMIMSEASEKSGQFQEAYNYASQAVEIDPNSAKAQGRYGEALAGLRGNDSGIEYMKNLVSSYPAETEYRLVLGRLYAKDHQYRLAEEVLLQVTEIDEKPKRAFMELGKIYFEQERYKESLDAFIKASVFDPADVEPLFRAGVIYLQVNKPVEAKIQFRRVLSINDLYPLVNYYIGRAALSLNQINEALQQAENEKRKNPRLADPYLLAAEAYMKRKNYDLCANEYQKAIRLRPQGADIYVKMARCYRKGGRLEIAASMLDQANSLESGNADIYLEQGQIYETQGLRLKAIEAYNQYLILRPNAINKRQVENKVRQLGG